MSRGKKLDIFIGAEIDDSWASVQDQRISKVADILEPQKHLLVFAKEKRRGKTVTLVGEFFLAKESSTLLLKLLKKKLSCGGTFKDGWMEFQGELKEDIKTILLSENFRFKHNHI